MALKSVKIADLKQIAILIIIIVLLILPVILIQNAIAEITTVFYGIKFPSGVISFADEVVTYQPIIYFNQEGLPNVAAPFNNPKTALKIPNSTDDKHPFLPLNKRNDVSLGIGGSITLQFKDNLLTASGDNKFDLWIFEAGETTETVMVEISKDGVNWYFVGKTNQEESGLDIDQFGWKSDDFFAYVRLTDDPFQGQHSGIWNERQWIGWGGADIDAVGAISSVSLNYFSSNWLVLFFPIFKWSLLMFCPFVIAFAVTFYWKKI